MEKNKIKSAIEAILFSFGESVEIDKIAKALELDKEIAQEYVHELMQDYEQYERGIRIIELENAYQMCSAQEYYEYLIKIKEQPKKHVLTDVLLETLSIIAYKQPITRVEIEKIRGVSCDHAVNRLVEYNLVQELGRLDAPGRPLLFGTTEEFLRSFGVNSIDELPTLKPEQVEEFKAQAEEEMNALEKVEV
ncbi:MAG: SMC-Scp complex subunit ScpB [Lachnospiraceae bacterium]